jgi:hypothetical protein
MEGVDGLMHERARRLLREGANQLFFGERNEADSIIRILRHHRDRRVLCFFYIGRLGC